MELLSLQCSQSHSPTRWWPKKCRIVVSVALLRPPVSAASAPEIRERTCAPRRRTALATVIASRGPREEGPSNLAAGLARLPACAPCMPTGNSFKESGHRPEVLRWNGACMGVKVFQCQTKLSLTLRRYTLTCVCAECACTHFHVHLNRGAYTCCDVLNASVDLLLPRGEACALLSRFL